MGAEYCFNSALPGLAHGYIGAGQVLQIRRGGDIDQRLLLDFARHFVWGEWCHIFLEGGVWQWDELGGRRQLPRGVVSVSLSDFGVGVGVGVGVGANEGGGGGCGSSPRLRDSGSSPPRPSGN